MSEDFGIGLNKFFTDINENLKSDDKKEKAKAIITLGLGFMNPLAMLAAGIIKGFMGMDEAQYMENMDAIAISDENALKPQFGNGSYVEEDYTTDISERPWQAVDISLLTDLSLLDNEEVFPKEKLMAMATQYTLGNQELSPEIKEHLEKKLGVTINDPVQDDQAFSSIDLSLLTPNVIKTLSDSQLETILKAHDSQAQELTDLQLQYIQARGILPTDKTDETDQATYEYSIFDPSQMTLESFISSFTVPEQLEQIAQKYEEGLQSLSPEMKAYIEQQLGRTIEDFDYTSLELPLMSLDDFKALNYDNFQLQLIYSQFTDSDKDLPEQITSYILQTILPNNEEVQTEELSLQQDETVVVDEKPVQEEIQDILPSGNNPFDLETTTQKETTKISEDVLYNIQRDVLEEYIQLYEQTPELIEFANEHAETQFMQLYNDYKAEYRKESEDLPEEAKNKLEANASGAGTT